MLLKTTNSASVGTTSFWTARLLAVDVADSVKVNDVSDSIDDTKYAFPLPRTIESPTASCDVNNVPVPVSIALPEAAATVPVIDVLAGMAVSGTVAKAEEL